MGSREALVESEAKVIMELRS